VEGRTGARSRSGRVRSAQLAPFHQLFQRREIGLELSLGATREERRGQSGESARVLRFDDRAESRTLTGFLEPLCARRLERAPAQPNDEEARRVAALYLGLELDALAVIFEDVAEPAFVEGLRLDERAHPAESLLARLQEEEHPLRQGRDLDRVLDAGQ